METLCILLCEKHTQSRKGSDGRQVSRWRLVVLEYSAICARLMNSQALLDGTSMALYAINQTTLASTHIVLVGVK